MFSNLITESLSKIDGFKFNFTDQKAYSKVREEKNNRVVYIAKLLQDYQKIALNLKYIEFKEIIANPNILKYRFEALKNENEANLGMAQNFKNVFEKVLQDHKDDYFDKIEIDGKKILDFSFDEAMGKLDSIMKELDEQVLNLEEILPEFLKDFTMLHPNLLNDIANNRIINSQNLNLALGNFPLIFIQKLIKMLIDDNELEAFTNLFDLAIEPESRDIVVNKIVFLENEMYNSDEFKTFFANIDRDKFDKAIQNFIQLFSDENLTSETSIFSYIGNYIQTNKTLLEEFTQNYFERFGNLLSLPLADLLQNAIVQSDEDLKIFCKISDIDISDFIVDVKDRIQNDFYQKYNYSTAIELDKKLNKRI